MCGKQHMQWYTCCQVVSEQHLLYALLLLQHTYCLYIHTYTFICIGVFKDLLLLLAACHFACHRQRLSHCDVFMDIMCHILHASASIFVSNGTACHRSMAGYANRCCLLAVATVSCNNSCCNCQANSVYT